MTHYNFQRRFLPLLCIISHLIFQVKANKVYITERSANCSCCEDFRKLPAFVCKNVTGPVRKLEYLQRYRDSGYDMGITVYDLEFTDVKHLPARVFYKHFVGALDIDDPELTVDENAFQGMMSLTIFKVKNSSITIVPDFSSVNDSITAIYISRSYLRSLEGKNLQNLNKIFQLGFVKNLISFIDPEVFKGTENVAYLHLSYNYLTSIPPNLLESMKNILEFRVDHNNLLHVHNLFYVNLPTKAFLQFNNITDLSFIYERIMNTSYKYYRYRCIEDEDVDYENLLTHYELSEKINMSYNLIQETSQPSIWCKPAISFLSSNFPVYFKIDELVLTGNKLRKLEFLLIHLHPVKLTVDRNQIQYLSHKDFISTFGVEKLELQNNYIKWIDKATFLPLSKYLKSLDLNNNILTSLNGSLRYLNNLEILKIGYNFIQHFSPEEFAVNKALSAIYLQHNQIKSIEHLQQLSHLRYLNITDNNIQLIRPEQVPKTLKSVDFARNPFKCSCQFQPFLNLLHTAKIITDVAVCSHSELGNKLYVCPSMCSCGCTNRGNDSFIFVDCNSNNLFTIPDFERNNHTGMNVTWTYYRFLVMSLRLSSNFYIEDNVLGVSFVNNSLESLESAKLPPNLIQLHLSNNKLRKLPESLFENQQNLKEVTLSGNPWICDCNTIQFKEWLTSEKNRIQDIDNVRCGKSYESYLDERIIWNLTDIDFCPSDVALIVSTTSGVLTFIIICLAAEIIYARYKFQVKVFLYSQGLPIRKEVELDMNKTFDAFVSFSHKDDEFVINEIVTVLENKDPNIRLCLHYRHFIPGEMIYKNIIRAVHMSKRTVVILSK